MKYFVEIEGSTYEVEIGAEGIRLNGRAVEADLERNHNSHLWHLVLNGRSYQLAARRRDERGAWEVDIDGQRHRALALDERRRAIRELAVGAPTRREPVEVRAPMPGLVIKIEVDREQQVEKGQGLAVIEAMKMENELKAPVAGRVTEVRVASGQAVDKGETLLVIAPAEE